MLPGMCQGPKEFPWKSSGSKTTTMFPLRRSGASLIESFLRTWFGKTYRPKVVVLGNLKGGSGKSTVAIHLGVGLMKCGYAVGSIDLDGHQSTLTHFMENRHRFRSTPGIELELPKHYLIKPSPKTSRHRADKEEALCFFEALEEFSDKDVVVVDTPGNESNASRLGHIVADTLITPVNDSFLDLDVFAQVDADAQTVFGPSTYALSVLSRWGHRMRAGGKPIEWCVARNRISKTNSRNRKQTSALLEELAETLGYRVIPGLSDRVIYRDAFLYGLTVLDLPYEQLRKLAYKSLDSARDEIWEFAGQLDISEFPKVGRRASRPAAE